MNFLSNDLFSRLKRYMRDSLTFGPNTKLAGMLAFDSAAQLLTVSSKEAQLEGPETIAPGTSVVVAIDPILLVKHEFVTPKIGKRDIESLVELEAERVFPVSFEKLSLAHPRTKPSGDEGFRIELFGVRKNLLNKIEANIAKRKLTLIKAVVGEGVELDPLEFKLAVVERRKREFTGILVGLTLFALFLISSVPDLVLDRFEAETLLLDKKIGDARKNTSTIADLQGQIQAMQNLASSVHAEKTRGQIVELIVKIAEGSPDDVVVDELRLDGDRLYIAGKASEPEKWLISLGSNGAFDNAALTSVAKNAGTTKQRFELRATVKWPSERRTGR